MATADERVLALAVACGRVEPSEAIGASFDDLIASGRLEESDRRGLAQDLADTEAALRCHLPGPWQGPESEIVPPICR